jgi:dihydroxy-acid dehydratase
MGFKKGEGVVISDAFESWGEFRLLKLDKLNHSFPFSPGAYLTGKINDEQREDIVRHACPGAGACGGMYT